MYLRMPCVKKISPTAMWIKIVPPKPLELSRKLIYLTPLRMMK